MKRREFLKGTSVLAAGVMLPSPLHAAQSRRPRPYDIIIVGAGTAGSIVATPLVRRFPRKKILLIEAGGPTSASVGGRDFPPYDTRATIFDVPGEYQNIPFQPKGEPYRQKETPFTFQGTGYGGNSQFNGMLFQGAPPFDFSESWPFAWRYRALRSYFDLIRTEMAGSIAHEIYRAHKFVEADTSMLGGLGERYFSHPFVVSHHGLRGGPVRSHLRSIVGDDGEPTASNLDLVRVVDINALRALAPLPRAPVPRPSRPQPRTPQPRWSRRHSDAAQ